MEDDPPFEEVERVGENRFDELEKIAEGGCASVYETRELIDTKRRVAIKLVQCSREELYRGTPSILRRFQDEVRTWNEFSTSRNVVRLFYTFRQKTRPPNELYFLGCVMELSELGDLSRNLGNRQLYASRRKDLYAFLRRIAVAIKEGHDKDITHGDIKPHNVLLFKSDGAIIPKVMDFGMGISASDDVALYGGTPEYLAPERFGEEGAFRRAKSIAEAKLSDIYSLGVLFYEIIVGHRPYQATGRLLPQERWNRYAKLHTGKPTDTERLASLGGNELCEFVLRMMSVDPKSRPSTMEVVLRLTRMQQDASLIVRREEDDCPIAKRHYRWNPAVHRQLGSRLYYYFIKGRSHEADPKWFKNQLEEHGIRYYSFYRILGGYDYILRVWVKASYAEQLDKLADIFKSQHRSDYMRFAVDSGQPCFASPELHLADEEAVLNAISSAAHTDKAIELSQLKHAGLVGGQLNDAERDSVRVFITVTVTGGTNEAMLRMYTEEIRRHMTSSPIAKDFSIYRGSGHFQILIKFRLLRFQEFRNLYDLFLTACEYVRVGDSIINSQTYIELDERGIVESDDGSIIGDLIARMDQTDALIDI